MTALVFSIGARVALENDQLTNMVPRTGARELLLILGPLASLMAIHYTLAVKSFGMRSLKTEGAIFLFCAGIFLAITLAYFLGQDVEMPAADCPRWKLLGCEGTIHRQANYVWSVVVALGGFGALILALWREKILRRR